MSNRLKVLDLFSGIGGFSLGLERAGIKTVAFCEIDPFCQKVLKKHWPDVPIYEDVRSLDYEGSVDLICGGYPCQPFSVAGNREGTEDDRHLWPSMFSLIQKHRPRWVIGENVAGHVSMGLDDVLSDLESESYTTRVFVIPACAAGASHIRNRVWIVANSEKLQCNDSKNYTKPGKRQESKFRNCDSAKNVANSTSKQSSSNDNGGKQGAACKSKQSEFRGRSRGVLRRRDWLPEPRVGRVVDGIPNGMDRLKSLGNAVVPQITEIIGRAIIAVEEEYENSNW